MRLLASFQEIGELSSAELVQSGLCDPIRVFVKNEPHTREKADQRRWRLISSVSLVDQIVERLLFSKQNKQEIFNWMCLPSRPGMGISDRAVTGTLDHVESSLSEGVHAYSSDISGFDWSVTGDELMWDAEMRCNLYGLQPQEAMARCMMNRVRCLSFAVFAFSNGQFIQQTIPGVQKSGSYNTSSTNSRIRVAMAVEAGAVGAIAMGDDCVEFLAPSHKDSVLRNYEASGKRVKNLDGPSDDGVNLAAAHYFYGYDPIGSLSPASYAELLETAQHFGWEEVDYDPESTDDVLLDFCSRVYVRQEQGDYAFFKGGDKAFFRLIHQPYPNLSLLTQFAQEMKGNSQFLGYLYCLTRVGWLDEAKRQGREGPRPYPEGVPPQYHDGGARKKSRTSYEN